MTRLFLVPNRGGDVRSRASINLSNSSGNIPSMYSYNNSSNINISRLNSNNSKSSTLDSNHAPQQHYLQRQHHNFSNSTNSIPTAYRETSRSGGGLVYRSHSFGGVSIPLNNRPWSTPTVLGAAVRRSPRAFSKVHGKLRSLRKSTRIPKIPCPGRTLKVFECVKRGIREYIQTTHEDIAKLITSENGTSTAQGRLLETDKKIKCAERYLKRLEFHLSKIDELHDYYLLNQRMREGARNMAIAFSTTTSHRRRDSIASIKYGYKECSQAMCSIEAELENLLGTFSCRLNGIAGFARVVPRDVFEVVIKHGDQKWKTKGKIEKDSTQHWDSPEHTFKCLVGEMLSIKASEVRAFKSVLLGQKSCEIWLPSTQDVTNQGLFSASSQLMTVSINAHGSLKLSIIITWNPLDGMDESITFSKISNRPPVEKRPVSALITSGSLSNSVSDLNIRQDKVNRGLVRHFNHQNDSGVYGSATSLPSQFNSDPVHHQPHFLSASPVHHAYIPSWRQDFHRGQPRPYSMSTFDIRNVGSQLLLPSSPTSELSNSSYHHSISMSSQSEEATSMSSSPPQLPSTSPSSAIPEITQTMIPGFVVQQMIPTDTNITEALGNLTTTLEDFLGHYPELQKLEEVVQVIDTVVRKPSITRSRCSSMNISTDGAIEQAFEFLNTEDLQDDFGDDNESEAETSSKMKAQISKIDRLIVSPSSTAKTADSGIESLAKCLQEDIHFDSSIESSSVSPSCGNEQVDKAFVFHLTFCDKLLEKMGNFGPLKCREFYALEQLQKQAQILKKLFDIAKSENEIDLHAVLSETSDKTLRELWMLCVDQTPLYVHPEKIISVLEQKFGAKLAEKYHVKSIRIFHQIMAHMLYVATYVPEVGCTSIVTLHQFMLFFEDEAAFTKMEAVAKELHLMDVLNASSNDTITAAISALQEELPPPVCLKMLMKLLTINNQEIQQSLSTYIKIINRNKIQREKALVVLVEGLEDHITEVRAGCCIALSLFEAEECINQLVHITQSDTSSTVRRKAKEALYSLGDAGRKAMEEAQLSSHGFQGLQMHKLSPKSIL